MSAQHGQCQHKNKTCTEQNGVYHRIDQYGNSHACHGFPCHRQPFRFHLSVVTQVGAHIPADQFTQIGLEPSSVAFVERKNCGPACVPIAMFLLPVVES